MIGRACLRIAAAAAAAATFAAVLSPVAAAKVITSLDISKPIHFCTTIAAPRTVMNTHTETLDVGAYPWGLVYLNSSIAFAAVNFSIAVLDTSEFTPKLVSKFDQPADMDMGNTVDQIVLGYGFRTLTLTHDKRNLYVATGYGAIIFDVPTLLAGSPTSPIVGTLSHENGLVGQSAIEISITPNDQFVFISQEFGNNYTKNYGGIEVYNVTRLEDGSVTSVWKGYVLTGHRTIGQDFSKDYTKLFVTNEMSSDATSQNETTGSITVLDVQTLKYSPGKSIVKHVNGGCHPARSVMSVEKDVLWVALRDSNLVAGYNATLLASNSTDDPLLITVNAGTSPLGMAAIKNHIFTADSNRFNYSDTTTGLTVIQTTSALRLDQTDFPQIPTGEFPREIAVSPDGNTLLVAEYGDGTIRAVNVTLLNI